MLDNEDRSEEALLIDTSLNGVSHDLSRWDGTAQARVHMRVRMRVRVHQLAFVLGFFTYIGFRQELGAELHVIFEIKRTAGLEL